MTALAEGIYDFLRASISTVTSDAGLLAYRELDDALGLLTFLNGSANSVSSKRNGNV